MPVSLPGSAGKRLLTGVERALTRRCPYCGGGGIFRGWFSIQQRCPNCDTLYAHEDGYFLGSYVINIAFTQLLTVGLVVWMLTALDLSVLQMQVIGVSLAIALPIFFYPFALLLWIAFDITFHDPATSAGPRR